MSEMEISAQTLFVCTPNRMKTYYALGPVLGPGVTTKWAKHLFSSLGETETELE